MLMVLSMEKVEACLTQTRTRNALYLWKLRIIVT